MEVLKDSKTVGPVKAERLVPERPVLVPLIGPNQSLMNLMQASAAGSASGSFGRKVCHTIPVHLPGQIGIRQKRLVQMSFCFVKPNRVLMNKHCLNSQRSELVQSR